MDISVRTTQYGVEDRSWLGSAHGTNATRSITLDLTAFNAETHYPDGYIPSGMVLGEITATGLFGPYTGDTSEVQTVTVTGSPTGGSFTLTFDGQTTAAIAYNAAASAVETALEALSTVGDGNVAVTGNAGGPYTVDFVGDLAGENVAQMTATASLTGGTSPGVTVATTTAGGADGASNGLQNAAGILFNTIDVTSLGSTATKFGAPLLEHGFVRLSNMPANSGLDENAISDLAGRIVVR